MVTRRWFLTMGGCAGVGLVSSSFTARQLQEPNPAGIDIQDLRSNLLMMVNEERWLERLPPVALDDLANRVATGHAVDMAKAHFVSHWGSDGRKPYQRYSFAGGTHATAENVSAANNTWSLKPKDIAQDIAYLHVRLYGEVPPNDGHRRAILAPEHTHVGFGIAIAELRLRMVELFVAKHVHVEPVQRRVKVGSTVQFAGRLLNPAENLLQIEVFYEPLPTPPTLEWLRTGRPYSLPDQSVMLRPKLAPKLMYADGTRGEIEMDSTTFRTLVTLFKQSPGIYTIACWIRSAKTGRPFIATQVCVQAD